MTGLCTVVPPRKRKDIRLLAQQLRAAIQWTEPRFPIVELMEAYHQLEPEFVYDIREVDEMGDDHGLTFPDAKIMLIREDIYERACDGHGRDRLTIAHEFGHLLMHTGLGYARKELTANISCYCSSEWQANCFGGELLISVEHIHLCQSPQDASELFGVSLEAAEYQWVKFGQVGLV